MKLPLSVIEVDVGATANIPPSPKLVATVERQRDAGGELVQDVHVAHPGDDVAILVRAGA